MGGAERSNPEKDPRNEQSQALLSDTLQWAGRIVDTQQDPEFPTVGHATIKDEVSDTTAFLKVGNLFHKYKIKYRDENRRDSSKDIVIEYDLETTRDGRLVLSTTGEFPDVTATLRNAGEDDEVIRLANEATDRLIEEAIERYATKDEVEFLHTVLELAIFGGEPFDFDGFQQGFDNAVARRDAMQSDADGLDKNNPD